LTGLLLFYWRITGPLLTESVTASTFFQFPWSITIALAWEFARSQHDWAMLDVDEKEDYKKGCAVRPEDSRVSLEEVLERPASEADSGLDWAYSSAYQRSD
jgi:hypothetical protein